MNIKRLLLIGIISFFLFLFIFAPAQLMSIALSKLVNSQLGLAAAQGSFWKGSAHVLIDNADNHANSLDIGTISWNTQPLQLLIGKFIVSLTWNQGMPFWVTIDKSRLNIEHADLVLPAKIISVLVPSLKVAQLGGHLLVHCDNFSLTRKDILGQMDIDWHQASSPLSIINPVGDYHAKLNGKGNGLSIQLTTLNDGPLMMQGNGSWAEKEDLHFEGTAEAKPAAKLEMQALLRVMGNESKVGSGLFQLRF